MSEDNIRAYLAEHPRMVGMLFMVFLLLTQVETVAAGCGGTCAGP